MDSLPPSGRHKRPAFGRQNGRQNARQNERGQRGADSPRPPPKPLDAARLDEMALAYVARFATSAGRLRTYLQRKLRERGWAPDADAGPDADPHLALAEGASRMEALIERFVAAGYVDDESYARGRTGGLLRRGFGRRRINEALGAAGIASDLREQVMPGEGAQRRAALALASKRRFGPFGADAGGAATDPARRPKQIAAMLRAGHGMDAARALISATSVEEAEGWAAEAQDDDGPEAGNR